MDTKVFRLGHCASRGSRTSIPAPGDDTTFFCAGQVLDRDGAIEKVVLSKGVGSQQPEFIVIVRSAGTGGYLSARAFTYGKRRLTLRASVNGLPPDADPLAALRRSKWKGKRPVG